MGLLDDLFYIDIPYIQFRTKSGWDCIRVLIADIGLYSVGRVVVSRSAIPNVFPIIHGPQEKLAPTLDLPTPLEELYTCVFQMFDLCYFISNE